MLSDGDRHSLEFLSAVLTGLKDSLILGLSGAPRYLVGSEHSLDDLVLGLDLFEHLFKFLLPDGHLLLSGVELECDRDSDVELSLALLRNQVLLLV